MSSLTLPAALLANRELPNGATIIHATLVSPTEGYVLAMWTKAPGFGHPAGAEYCVWHVYLRGDLASPEVVTEHGSYINDLILAVDRYQGRIEKAYR